LLIVNFGKIYREIAIEWKIIYIGSAADEKFDQVLDTVEVGPLACGTMKFTFEVFFMNYWN